MDTRGLSAGLGSRGDRHPRDSRAASASDPLRRSRDGGGNDGSSAGSVRRTRALPVAGLCLRLDGRSTLHSARIQCLVAGKIQSDRRLAARSRAQGSRGVRRQGRRRRRHVFHRRFRAGDDDRACGCRPVLSQPSMPMAIGSSKRAAEIDASAEEIACVKRRFEEEGLSMIGMRFRSESSPSPMRGSRPCVASSATSSKRSNWKIRTREGRSSSPLGADNAHERRGTDQSRGTTGNRGVSSLTAKRSRPEMAPQRLEKIESGPGNGMGSETSNPQDMVHGRAG